ncbi:MAG: ATP/maltotriose-dependent transcriptional regulator MalT [Gammaproteobacteria bacterium]|jgi:ATP/maltotriose-dependent transcriptional regulator MalT
MRLLVRENLVSAFDTTVSNCRLACIIAPAGYGKSTLMGQWIDRLTKHGIPSGWISLDQEHDDPVRFLAYLGAALKPLGLDIDELLRAQLHDGTTPLSRTLLHSIARDLSAVTTPFVLFLDDLHLVSESVIADTIAFLIRHAPTNIRFAIASRVDLQFSLSELKMAGSLLTVGPKELRLRLEETSHLVNDMNSLGLTAAEVVTLHDRTEGWIAGLQLFSMSVDVPQHAGELLRAFSGADRDVVRYLGDVVLSKQPEEVRNFLMRTSILDRFCRDLCVKISGLEESRTILEHLNAHNMFLIPLDRRDEWYRYHHLFADFLRKRFSVEQPDELASTYGLASDWFAEQGHYPEAIQYAFAAQDHDKAARLISEIGLDLVRNRGEHATLLKWTSALSSKAQKRWPITKICRAWSMTASRNTAAAEREIRQLEQLSKEWDDHSSPSIVAERASMISKIRAARCTISAILDKSSEARSECVRWLREDTVNDPDDIALVNNVLGIACISTFAFEQGFAAVDQALRSLQHRDAPYNVSWSAAVKALLMIEQGRLSDARESLEGAVAEVEKTLGSQSLSAGLLSIVFAEILYEADELEAAEEALETGFSIGLDHGIVETTLAACITNAKILFSKGMVDAALEVLEEGESREEKGHPGRLSLTLRDERIKLLLRANRFDEAQGVAEQFGLLNPHASVQGVDDREATLEIPKIVRARLRIASAEVKRVSAALTPLIGRAQEGGRQRKVVELLILMVKAAWIDGKRRQAFRYFSRALSIGARNDLYRTFLDEGPEILGDVVAEIPGLGTQLDDVGADHVDLRLLRRLADGFGVANAGKRNAGCLRWPDDTNVAMTKRELDVLRKVSSGLSNVVVASALFVSEKTVKWHLQNIYRKLDVRSRGAAVTVGRGRGLIP